MAAIAPQPTSTALTPKNDESLPVLVGRLGDDIMQLFDTKVSLLKVEVKEEVNEYARGGILIGRRWNHCGNRVCSFERCRRVWHIHTSSEPT